VLNHLHLTQCLAQLCWPKLVTFPGYTLPPPPPIQIKTVQCQTSERNVTWHLPLYRGSSYSEGAKDYNSDGLCYPQASHHYWEQNYLHSATAELLTNSNNYIRLYKQQTSIYTPNRNSTSRKTQKIISNLLIKHHFEGHPPSWFINTATDCHTLHIQNSVGQCTVNMNFVIFISSNYKRDTPCSFYSINYARSIFKCYITFWYKYTKVRQVLSITTVFFTISWNLLRYTLWLPHTTAVIRQQNTWGNYTCATPYLVLVLYVLRSQIVYMTHTHTHTHIYILYYVEPLYCCLGAA